MKNLKILPYNIASESAKALAAALDVYRVNKENTAIKGSKDKILVNWGNSVVNHEQLLKCSFLNNPKAVGETANKLTFFRMFKGEFAEIVPPWTPSRDQAFAWLEDDKSLVVARTKLNAHSGEGIILVNRAYVDENGMPKAPLYTKYVPKKEEYRIHFSRKTGIFFKQRKAMVEGTQNPNWKIRNLAGGFIYANVDVQTPKVVDRVAEMFYNGMEAGGLDFGALDIIYNEKTDRAYILEVNTAPGLAGRTLEAYTGMIRAYTT